MFRIRTGTNPSLFVLFLFSLFFLMFFSSTLLFAQSAQEETYQIKITVSGETLYGTLNNSITSREFVKMLPVTFTMKNLYSREMVIRLNTALPTDNVTYRGYRVGEIIYWPPGKSFVFMYEQNGENFSMQKMGFLSSDLSVFSGLDSAVVKIELIDTND